MTTIVLYAYLPIRSAMDPPLDYADPETWEAFRYVVLGEQFRGTFSPLPSLSVGAGRVWEQLLADLGPVALLSVVGAICGVLRWPRLMGLTGLWFVLTFVFALGYLNADIGRYYAVPILLALLWATLGVAAIADVAERLLGRGLASRPPRPSAAGHPTRPAPTATARIPARALSVLGAFLLLAPSTVALPRTFDEVDASGERDARVWLEATLAAIEPDAVVVSWWSYSTPLWYGRFVEGRRPDVTVIDDRTILDQGLGDVIAVIGRHLGERPVYIIRLPRDLDEVAARYRLEPVPGAPGMGGLRRVVPPAAPG